MDLLKMNSKEREKILKELRQNYPANLPVELISMDDPYADMPKGLKGVVKSVDDIGTIHVSWENGSSLGVVYGVDKIKVFLESCPFCGSKQILIHNSQVTPQLHFQVYCYDCGCGTMGHPNKEKAVNIWNGRECKHTEKEQNK